MGIRNRKRAIVIGGSAVSLLTVLLLMSCSWSATDVVVDAPDEPPSRNEPPPSNVRPFAEHPPLSNVRPLTKEETIGLIFRADAPLCVRRKANPEARSVALAVLANPKLVDFHAGTANMLGHVCSEGDVAELEADIVRRAALPLGSDELTDEFVAHHRAKALVWNLCMALAVMDRRGIEAAGSLLRRMASEQYWRERSAGHGFPDSVAKETFAYRYRRDAVGAYIWTLRPDADAVAEAAASSLSENRRRAFKQPFKGFREAAEKSRYHFDYACPEKTHEEWRAKLLNSWNQDAEDPQPTESRVLPYSD